MRKREVRHHSRPFPHLSLAAALKKALRAPKIKRHLTAAEINKNWEAIVGSTVAEHVHPVSYEKGILTLKADSSVWRQQISLIKSELLDQISENQTTLKVRDLRVI